MTEAVKSTFLDKFTVLRTAPRELWIVYFAKIMEIAAYGLVNMGLMLYLISDVGFNEITAGSIIAVFSISLSFFTLLAGGLTDAIGIKKTFLWGYALAIGTRLVATFSDNWVVVVVGSLAPMSIALALMVPVMTAAVRRYTNTKQRSMGFSLYYVLMNVGFIIAGWLFDATRNGMGKDGVLDLGFYALSVYQTIFLISVGFTIAGMLPILLFLRKGVEMDEEEDSFTIDPAREAGEEGNIVSVMARTAVKTGSIFKDVMSEKAFFRFLLLVTLMVGVKMVFYHMHYTLPPWADRELGFGSRFGTAWGILNPAIIVILVPLIGALAQKVPSYVMMVVGTFLSASPTFLLALPNDALAGLGAWGPVNTSLKWFLNIDGDLSPVYVNLILFVIIFSVGEAIWSPRLYEYTASVAPRGREGTYMGMSILPYFGAKILVGPLSGILLASYAPEEGVRTSSTLWIIVASMAIVTPIALLVLKPIINPKQTAQEPATEGGAA